MDKDMLKEIVYTQSKAIAIQVMRSTGHALLDAAERMESKTNSQPSVHAATPMLVQEG